MQSIISLLKGLLASVVMYLFGVIADISSPKMAVMAAMIIKIAILMIAFVVLKRTKLRS